MVFQQVLGFVDLVVLDARPRKMPPEQTDHRHDQRDRYDAMTPPSERCPAGRLFVKIDVFDRNGSRLLGRFNLPGVCAAPKTVPPQASFRMRRPNLAFMALNPPELERAPVSSSC